MMDRNRINLTAVALLMMGSYSSAFTGAGLNDRATRQVAVASLCGTAGVPLGDSCRIASNPTITSLREHIFCGYQGWFMARGDGFDMGFVHWGNIDGSPPKCTVDLWPDLSEYDADETFATSYRHADGSVARVFSSVIEKTVQRHFRWMRDYGIDGAFVQRFDVCIDPANPTWKNDRRTNTVLRNCRRAAEAAGRGFAVMYDCHFDAPACEKIQADWTRLTREMKLLESDAYIHHAGAPIVALWGYGFDHRRFDVAATEKLFRFLRDPANGGCVIMLGLPNDWAEWSGEKERLIREHVRVLSPWNVGRYRDETGAERHFERYLPKDLAYCRAHAKDYLPVVFPGFSWTNLTQGKGPLGEIPRRGGRFFWKQFETLKRFDFDTAYVAMFDEVDEGTAIFKVTNDPPVGRFVTLEGLPSDFYLRLTGLGGRMLRGERVEFPKAPARSADGGK